MSSSRQGCVGREMSISIASARLLYSTCVRSFTRKKTSRVKCLAIFWGRFLEVLLTRWSGIRHSLDIKTQMHSEQRYALKMFRKKWAILEVSSWQALFAWTSAFADRNGSLLPNMWYDKLSFYTDLNCLNVKEPARNTDNQQAGKCCYAVHLTMTSMSFSNLVGRSNSREGHNEKWRESINI